MADFPQNPGPGGPTPQWDGQHWVAWNGHAWEIMADQPAGPPPSIPGPSGEGQPPGGYGGSPPSGYGPPQPSGYGPRPPERSNQTLKLALVGVCILALLGIGGTALALTLNRDSNTALNAASGSPSATPAGIQTIPINSGANAFTPPAGTDQPVTPVVPQTAVSVKGGEVGLYGGTLSAAQCNKEQLVTYLEQNPDKGSAWASVIGIQPGQIRTYVDGLTSVILRSDTFITTMAMRTAGQRRSPQCSKLVPPCWSIVTVSRSLAATAATR